MRVNIWVLNAVLCLMLVSAIGAQEEEVQELTAVIIDSRLGADDYLFGASLCYEDDCLAYDYNRWGEWGIVFLDFSTVPPSRKTFPTESMIFLDNFSFDDQYLSFSTLDEERVFIWDRTEDRLFEIPTVFDLPVVLWNKSDQLHQFIVADFRKNISQLWDAKKSKLLSTYENIAVEHSYPRIVAFREGDPFLEIYDAHTGDSIGQIHNGAPIRAIFWSDTTSNIFTLSDDIINVWNIETKTKVFAISADNKIDEAVLSGDGSQLVFLENGDWKLWDVGQEKQISGSFAHESDEELITPSWNTDNTLIMTYFNRPVGCEENCKYGLYVWDAKTGEQLMKLTDLAMGRAAWIPESEMILALAQDNESAFYVWDARSGQKIYRLPQREPAEPYGWDVNQDGTKILTWTDEHLYVWTLPQP